MKIALFGGSGFVGKRVLESLQENSFEVTEISRNPVSNRNYQADITQLNSLSVIEKNFDIVVICSSQLPQREYHEQDFSRFIDVNIKGICNILIWAGQSGVKKIIYCSTLSFLPTKSEDESELMDTNSHYLYKISKAAAEHLVIGFCKQRNMEYSSLRIASVYGPGMKKDILHLFYQKIIQGEKIIIQNSTFAVDFIHVDDVAKAVVKSCQYPVKKIINIGSGNLITLPDLIQLIAKLVNRQVPSMEILSREPIERRIYSANTVRSIIPEIRSLEAGLRDLISTW
jgi:nucleoside-diphosphate-sugar epimerase